MALKKIQQEFLNFFYNDKIILIISRQGRWTPIAPTAGRTGDTAVPPLYPLWRDFLAAREKD
jgi:hypothetical protein